MSSSLCPHLVQEYFERVADILTTYRPQILKQVEYDRISENLVLRGAVRQEEHQRIFECADLEGQVSQMLVVVQNRMWGLENLLAALMEEHVSAWLAQELFRAYTEHLVGPMKRQKDRPVCQCVQLPSSLLYRGWVKALKSLDSLILKTGNNLGFMRQTLYPTDNMLTFLSEKLAEYTGGESCSTNGNDQDELVPYGFAPNTAGEVQVAELEEDDINDLFSLSETLCIAYHNSSDATPKEMTEEEEMKSCRNKGTISGRMGVTFESSLGSNPTTVKDAGSVVIGKPVVPRKATSRKNTGATSSSRVESSGRRQRRYSEEPEVTSPEPPQSPCESTQERLARQRELIARLTAPKSPKSGSSSSTTVSLRNPGNAKILKQRPNSAEFNYRSVSGTLPLSPPPITPLATNDRPTSPKTTENAAAENKQVTVAAGKAQGFVRSKSQVHPPVKGQGVPKADRPTAVAKPTVKDSTNKNKPTEKSVKRKEIIKREDISSEANPSEDPEDEILKKTKLFHDLEDNQDGFPEDPDISSMLPEMSKMMLSNTILATDEEKRRSLGYYQLNFDDVSD